MVGLVAERMWNVEIAATDKTTTKTVMRFLLIYHEGGARRGAIVTYSEQVHSDLREEGFMRSLDSGFEIG